MLRFERRIMKLRNLFRVLGYSWNVRQYLHQYDHTSKDRRHGRKTTKWQYLSWDWTSCPHCGMPYVKRHIGLPDNGLMHGPDCPIRRNA
jgi:hypothetical protein